MSRPQAIARAALGVIALLLVAWFAVLARNERMGEAASHRVATNPGMGAAQWARAMEDLSNAGRLKPGTEWKVTRGNYLLLRDKRAALRVAESVVKDEPENLDAWAVVLKGSSESDPIRSAHAGREVRRLVPLEQR